MTFEQTTINHTTTITVESGFDLLIGQFEDPLLSPPNRPKL